MKKKYVVDLSDSQRQLLKDCMEKGQTTAYKIRHAHILLRPLLSGSLTDIADETLQSELQRRGYDVARQRENTTAEIVKKGQPDRRSAKPT